MTKEKTQKTHPISTTQASIFSIVVIGLLIVIKVVAAFVTDSVSLKSDALHSSIDFVGAIVGLIAIRIAVRPPDTGHPYGHGKAENVAGMLISVLIFAAGAFIAYEAIVRLIEGGEMEMAGVGIAVTVLAIVLNISASLIALRIAKKNKSAALEATAKDMLADVYSSIAVLVGLILVSVTGWIQFDAIVALLVSLIIFRTAFGVFKKSADELMDKALPEEDKQIIKEILLSHNTKFSEYHEVRARTSGGTLYVDMHLTLNRDLPLKDVDKVCDEIEEHIKQKYPDASIIIHPEPCDGECEKCHCNCSCKDDNLKKKAIV